jgi:ribosomal protein S18 acetylase RimI-like enzyme
VVKVTVVFCNADKSDLEELCRFYEKPYGGYETARKFVEIYLDHYFVKLVKSEGKIIGRLIWFPREDPKLGWAEILDLGIKNKYQRRGFGFRLMREAIADVKMHFESLGHTARCIILFTSEKNTPARKLYEKVGFRKVGYGGYVSEEGTRELLYSLNF